MAGICYQFAERGTCQFGDRCKFSHVSSKTSNKKSRSRRQKRSRNGAKASRDGPIAVFFAQYPEFEYDPQEEPRHEFYRMCDYFEWDREDQENKEAYAAFKDALVLEFNDLYGTDVDDIESWRGLCVTLELPLPKTSSAAKEMFKETFVNLEDLVDTSRTGERVQQFASLKELKEYTIQRGKYFPRESAYAGGVLKFLLREILSSYHGARRPNKRSKRGRK